MVDKMIILSIIQSHEKQTSDVWDGVFINHNVKNKVIVQDREVCS
jgi:hypothetical protein